MWAVGDTADVQRPSAPLWVLMGGGKDVDAAMRKMIEKSGGGDFVILRASGADGYNNYLYQELGGVHSVETFLVDSREKAQDPLLARKVRNAEAVFIAGGDQSQYVNYWKGTRLSDALNYLAKDKQVPLGGTSAGCAILGEVYYAALMPGSLTTADLLANPLDERVTLGMGDFLQLQGLEDLVTDTHYDERDRKGRHAVFLAHLLQKGAAAAKGIGVSEATAVLVEGGQAYVLGSGRAHFLRTSQLPERMQAGQKLHWERGRQAVSSWEGREGDRFDLQAWKPLQGGKSSHLWVSEGVLGELAL